MNDIAAAPAGRAGPSRRGRRPVRPTLIIAAGCAVVVAAVVLCWPRTTVLKVLSQPPGVQYADDSTHVAVLKHVRAPIAALQFLNVDTSAVDRYEVVMGRDPGGGYGHRIRIEAAGADPADLTVEWTTDGAWLVYRSGHRLFVPAKYFIGGR
jgi:hypothetical protein